MRELLADLRERGLNTEAAILVVLDGAKALPKGVREVFGQQALIQRCRVHKLRNVVEHLPLEKRQQATWRLRGAWAKATPEKALKELRACVKWLDTISPNAARSLEEGLEETLTITRLGLHESLVKTFSSTNLIESYNNAGDLTTMAYSDGTPAVSYGHDRRGRQTTVTQGSISTSRSFDDAGNLLAESYSGGPLAGLSVTNGYDEYLRRTNLSAQHSSTPLLNHSFAYDNASRLQAVTDGTFSSAQGVLVGSRLSYWESYCLARCTCEPEGLAGRLGQKGKEQVHETMG